MRSIMRALLVAMLATTATSSVVAQSEKPSMEMKAAVNLNTATIDQLEELPGIGIENLGKAKARLRRT